VTKRSEEGFSFTTATCREKKARRGKTDRVGLLPRLTRKDMLFQPALWREGGLNGGYINPCRDWNGGIPAVGKKASTERGVSAEGWGKMT